MSRSKDPKCPNGRNCGVCNLAKKRPPVRDRRKTQVGRDERRLEA